MLRRLPPILLLLIAWLLLPALQAQDRDSSLNAAMLRLSQAEARNDREALAEAHRELAGIYQKQNRFPQARDHYLQSLVHLDSILQQESWATIHQELGDVYNRIGSFEEALNAYDRVGPYFQAQKDFNRLGRLGGKIGFTYINMGEPARAKKKLDEALAFFDRAAPVDSTSLADLFITFGILNSKQANYPEALSYYQRAEALYAALGNRQRLMYVYNNMSGAYLAHGNSPKALDYLQKTVRLSEEFNFKTGIASGLGNIAMVYLMHKDYEQALDYLQRSKQVNQEMGDSAHLGRIYNNMGEALQALGKTDEALEHFRQSLEIRSKISDKTGIASANLRIGALQTVLGDYPLARSHLEAARLIWEKAGDRKGMSESYQKLGEMALAQKQYGQAVSWCEKGYRIAGELRLAEELEGTCACLAGAYEGAGDFRKALDFHKRYLTARDSLINEDRTREITRLEMQYQFDAEKERIALEQERNEAVLNSRLQRQRLFRNASLGGLAAGLIILALLWRSYRQKQKSNRLLEAQNSTIQKTLEERETLLKEIHHRVKNNLQVVSSLLSLQSRTIADRTALDAIEEGRNRVKAMALIHQNLYQEENLVGVNLPEYIEKLTDSLVYSYQVDTKRIWISRQVSPVTLDVDTLIPLGLILNELISNALKYAFTDREEGKIHIEIDQKEEGLKVLVEDDGVGMPPGFQMEQTDSLGFKLVRAFVEKMKAQMEVLSQEGTRVSIFMPHPG